MQGRRLGNTGHTVGSIGLGGMPLSIDGRPSEAQAIRVIHAALDAGMTLIDTADVYCIDDADIGHNERLIAKALAAHSGRGDGIVVATKGGLRRPRGDWVTDGRPEHLRAACEKSLAALGVETIELYQLHAPDNAVPFADTVGELARLREEGKVRHVGLSNVTVVEIDEAAQIVPIASVQNRCNPHDLRAFTQGVVARCERDGLAFLPYGPVGGGNGKTRVGRDPHLGRVAERHGASPFEVALAWLLASSPSMVPIPGASRVDSATSSARAAALVLTEEDRAALRAAFSR